MNNGAINGFSIDGAAIPNWVVRAVVAATAAASFVVTPVRTVYAQAYGDAVVNVTLSQYKVVAGYATAHAESTSAITSHTIFSGRATTQATVFGAAAYLRNVFASAGGDAFAYSLALVAQSIGEATASASSSVVSSVAHIIHPGLANVPVLADSFPVASDVNRYATTTPVPFALATGRGEASQKRNNFSYFEHDGYVPLATAGISVEVLQDRTAIIVGLGTFTFADGDAIATSFVKHKASASGLANVAQGFVQILRQFNGSAISNAEATGNVEGYITTFSTATGELATAESYGPKALQYQLAKATSDADGSSVAPAYQFVAYARAFAESGAYLVSTAYAKQYFSVIAEQANSFGYATASQNFAVAAAAEGSALLARSTFGTQYRAEVVGDAVVSIQTIDCNVLVFADADATAIAFGTGMAATNADVKAPDDRYMTVPGESRAMVVPYDDRTMVSA